ncbi:MAG: adenosylcobinamide-GDP ribazoletransferase, partial [Gammaproteobacteria bacterium]|nr:adenosylcobinamide-GDP ribazoletransferase [Gammaproteobacteria bacterium]
YGLANMLPENSLILNAAIITVLWIVLTGGLHVDGLGDSADAWVGGMGDRQRTLDIMKDPYCGPMGVIAIVSVILLKFAALYTVLQQNHLLLLLLIPMVGRAQILLLFLTTPYVREGGMGSVLSTHLPKYSAWIIWGVVLLLWCLLPGVESPPQLQTEMWIGLAVVMLFFILFRRAIMQRIGGTTGDSAGALIELSETILLVTIALQ